MGYQQQNFNKNFTPHSLPTKVTSMKPNQSSNKVQLLFREAAREDLPTLITLLHDDPLGGTRETLNNSALEKYQSAFDAIVNDKNACLIVGTQDNQVVAMAQINFLSYLTYQGGRRAQIEGVRVEKHQRGKGVGKKLIEYLIQMSIKQKCHLVQLTTNKKRPKAISFYESLGFVATHEGIKLDLKS